MLTAVMFIPATQSWAGKKATNWLNKKYELNTSVSGLRYSFPDNFIIKDLFVPDDQLDTLIFARELNLNFSAFISEQNELSIRKVAAEDVQFNWLIKKGDTLSNLKYFSSKFKKTEEEEDPNKPDFKLKIGDIELKNTLFVYENRNCSDCEGYHLREIETHLKDFDLEGPYLNININDFSTIEGGDYALNQLKGLFHYGNEEIALREMELTTDKSHIDGDLSLEFDTIIDFKDFLNKVKIHADLGAETQVVSSDLIEFIPKFPDFEDFRISGNIHGVLNNLKAENLIVKLGDDTELSSNLELYNPTSAEDIFIDAENLKLISSIDDAEKFVSIFYDKPLPEKLKKLKRLSFDGDFKGFLNNFNTEGLLTTNLGEVDMNLFLNNQDTSNVAYRGDLKVTDLNLEDLLDNPNFGKLTADMSLNGKGLSPSEMNTTLKGSINEFDFKDYHYTNANIDGKIENGDFKGDFRISDPNVKLDFKGNASLSKEISSYDFVANIDTANLFALNLTKDSIVNVSSELDINFKALNYDKWQGSIRVTKTTVENVSDFYFFQDILVESNSFQDSNKTLTVKSNILDGTLKGEYKLKAVADAIVYHTRKFVKDPTKEEVRAPDANFEFDIHIKNTRVLSEIFFPDLYMESNSTAQGSYAGETKNLTFDFNSPGFDYKNNKLSKVSLNYAGDTISSLIDLNINNTKLNSGVEVDSLILDNQLFTDTLFFDFKWVVKDSIGSKTYLRGYAFQKDTTGFEFGIAKSEFNIGNRQYYINGNNRILVNSRSVHVDGLVIAGPDERIIINGNISKSPNEILRIDFEDFNMELVNYFLRDKRFDFDGGIHGGLILSEALSTPRFAIDLNVDSLKMNEEWYGNLNLGSDWFYGNDSISIFSSLKKGTLDVMQVDGVYLANTNRDLDLDLKLNQFAVKSFNPFLKGLAENFRGFLSGDLEITGKLSEPVINGDLYLPKVAAKIGFLQTDYNLSGNPKVHLMANKFVINDLNLRDTKYGTKGIVNGEITHKNFQDFDIDLSINADELLALNTNAQNSETYYGRAYVSGLISFKGKPDNMIIKANVAAKRNSAFYLLLDGATEVSRSDYVVFVNPAEDQEKDIVKSLEASINKGLSLDFNIDIDQNSEMQLIIDQQTGTKLRSVGEGAVRIVINPFQDIQMFGSYTATEGDFILSLENVIKKEFSVERGGTVSWNGSPTEALVNMSATYETRADPSPLVPDYDGGRTWIDVKLDLSGELMNLDKNFSIEAPRANANTQTTMANRLSDQDKLNQQVFSLLAMDAFLPDQGISGGEFVSNSANAFDFLANQASSWINQATGDYNVSLSYQNAATTAVNDDGSLVNSQEEVEVGVSKRFFDDRVTVNGRVGVALGENQQGQDQVAGDFELEYNITEDGRFRTKAFNRSVQDQYSFTEQNYQQGVGLFYQVNFNTWQELIKGVFGDKNASENESDARKGDAKKEEEALPEASE